jgi:ATP-binding cassette subfamily C protein CydD
VASNVSLGDAMPNPELVARSLTLAGIGGLNPDTSLGVGGSGLSGGQAQRVAVARAIYRSLARDCPVVVLDEPSSALDADTEFALIDGLRTLAASGRVVLVVSHRLAFLDASTRVTELGVPQHA